MFLTSDLTKDSFRSARRGKRGQLDASGGYTDSVIPNKGFSAQLQSALEQREAEKEEARHTKNMQMALEVKANADPTRSHKPGLAGGAQAGKGAAVDPRLQAAQLQAMGQQMAAQSMQANGAAVSYQPVPQAPMIPAGVATPMPPRAGSFSNYIPPPMAAMGGQPLMQYAPPACGSASMPFPTAGAVGYAQSISQLQQFSGPMLMSVPTGAVAAAPMQPCACPRVSYVPPPGTQLQAPGTGSFVAMAPVAPGSFVAQAPAPLVPGSGSFVAPGVMTPVMPPPGVALTPRGGNFGPGGVSVCVAPPPAPVGGASVCVAAPPGSIGYGSYVGPPVGVPTTPHGSYMPPPMMVAQPGAGSGSFVPLAPGGSLSRSNSFIGTPMVPDGLNRSSSFVRQPGHILSRTMPATTSLSTPRGVPMAAPLAVSSQSGSFAGAPMQAPGSGSMRLPHGGSTTPSTSFVAMPLGSAGGYPPLAPSLAAQAALRVASKEAQPRHSQAVSSQVTSISRTPSHRMSLDRTPSHRMPLDRSVTPRRTSTIASAYTPKKNWPSYTPTRADPMAMMHSPDAIRWPRVPA